MSIENSQKVAVITGASQGIGAGLVDAYRNRDYAVVATSRNIQDSSDPGVVTVRGDIADPGTPEHVIGAGLEQFGRIDTLVNNAGIFFVKPFTDYTQEEYDAITGVNLEGFFRTTQLAVEQMLPEGGGHVVQVSTSLVNHASSALNSVLASMTKGGLESATKSLAIEYATRGIRSNAVSLGDIKTPLNPEEVRPMLAELHPMKRMGEIDEVVEAVMYLEGADFVTGEIMHVDGGQSAGI
jgi:NAD(P)-dependent dehydrogenase (short-subunit alcohol dehydrogenase family)